MASLISFFTITERKALGRSLLSLVVETIKVC